ncbi:MAG: DUF1318 domain-containing protein [Candidatus Brocadiia bacterium]|nr:DUF1318 domain-containing protein [Candidatus Brocadiia bacterium]
MKKFAVTVAACALLWCMAGCGWMSGLVGTRIEVRATARSLREQVLGSYDQMSGEVFLLAGVRAVDPLTGEATPAPTVAESKKLALDALRRMEFNRDDVLAFKRLGLVGEAVDGRLVFLARQRSRLRREDPWFFSLVEDIVGQENADREALARRIVEITPSLQGEDGMKAVGAILAHKYRMESEPGTPIQLPDDTWTVKSSDEDSA